MKRKAGKPSGGGGRDMPPSRPGGPKGGPSNGNAAIGPPSARPVGASVTPLGDSAFVVTYAPDRAGVTFEAKVDLVERDGRYSVATTWLAYDAGSNTPRSLRDGERQPLSVVHAPRLKRGPGADVTAEHVPGTEFVVVGFEEDVTRSKQNLKHLGTPGSPVAATGAR